MARLLPGVSYYTLTQTDGSNLWRLRHVCVCAQREVFLFSAYVEKIHSANLYFIYRRPMCVFFNVSIIRPSAAFGRITAENRLCTLTSLLFLVSSA